MTDLTYSQQKTVCAKFRIQQVPIPPTPTNRYPGHTCRVHCTMCAPIAPASAPLPNHRRSRRGHTINPSTWQRDFTASNVYPVWGAPTEHNREQRENIEVLFKHLVEVHKVQPCNICNQLVTGRGLTRHQAAPDCQGELRRFSMTSKGYERLGGSSYTMFGDIVGRKKREIERVLPWEDDEAFLLVERSAEDAVRWFMTELGIRPAFTSWEKKRKEYEKEYWAPPMTTTLLNAIQAPFDAETDELFISTLHQWVNGDDEMRDAILGVLELQNEAHT